MALTLAPFISLGCERKPRPAKSKEAETFEPSVNLPPVNGGGSVPVPAGALAIELSAKRLVVHDSARKVLPLDAAEESANPAHVDATALQDALRPGLDRDLVLYVDRQVGIGVTLEILSSLATGRHETAPEANALPGVSLAVKVGTATQALPIDIPAIPKARAAVPASEAEPGDAFFLKPGEEPPSWADPVQPIVSMTEQRTLLWSLSGSEGTMQAPRLDLSEHDPEVVGEATAEIVARRYAEHRPEEADSIVVQAAPKTVTWKVAQVIDAVRPSFPEVVLAGPAIQ